MRFYTFDAGLRRAYCISESLDQPVGKCVGGYRPVSFSRHLCGRPRYAMASGDIQCTSTLPLNFPTVIWEGKRMEIENKRKADYEHPIQLEKVADTLHIFSVQSTVQQF